MEFIIDLYKVVVKGKEIKNVLFLLFSISLVLVMVLVGVKGLIWGEIVKCIKFFEGDFMYNFFLQLKMVVLVDGSGVGGLEFVFVNCVWVDEFVIFKFEFQKIFKDSYGFEVVLVDFYVKVL